jgi:hypothetical protein
METIMLQNGREDLTECERNGLHELAADKLDFVAGGEQATNLLNPFVQTALSAAQWYLWRHPPTCSK